MFKAIIVTFIIFAILFSGIIALKRSANHWKVPKGVKPQPYDDDEESPNTQNKNERPQLEHQPQNKQTNDSSQADKQEKDS